MKPPRTIIVQYFAMLREERGVTEERIATAAETPRALFEDLRQLHGFSLDASRLKVVINDAFAGWDDSLSPGDRVVFIPPVAGG